MDKTKAELEQRYRYQGKVPLQKRADIELEIVTNFLEDFPGTEVVKEDFADNYRQWVFGGDGTEAIISSYVYSDGELSVICMIW